VKAAHRKDQLDNAPYQACYCADCQSENQGKFESETLCGSSHTATALVAVVQFSPLVHGRCHCLDASGSYCWTGYTSVSPQMAADTVPVSQHIHCHLSTTLPCQSVPYIKPPKKTICTIQKTLPIHPTYKERLLCNQEKKGTNTENTLESISCTVLLLDLEQ